MRDCHISIAETLPHIQFFLPPVINEIWCSEAIFRHMVRYLTERYFLLGGTIRLAHAHGHKSSPNGNDRSLVSEKICFNFPIVIL